MAPGLARRESAQRQLRKWSRRNPRLRSGNVLALGLGTELSVMFQLPRLPLYYLAFGVIVLWLIGLGATLHPARRAASVAPAIATRAV